MQWNNIWERVTNWELWPFPLRYAGIAPVWAWYCIRSGTPWFFSASNPTITFGGFDGEGKREMYEQLPEAFYPKTIYIQPGQPEQELQLQLVQHQFSYPLCVKPDVGLKGLLFRKIDTESELMQYHRQVDVPYLVQDLVLLPLEVSVFYYRHPNREKGVITGFIQKDLMEVVGDGQSTVAELIAQHPIARHRMEEMRSKHAANLNRVLAAGERFLLTYAANLNRGAKFSRLDQHIDADLLRLFDDLSHQTSFYYGRYDIKCQSVADLKAGRNFQILEFNGAGAEPNHVYHAGLNLFQAYREILRHWKVLFQISRYNHRHGQSYWPFWKGYRFLKAAGRHGIKLQEMDSRVLV